MTRYNQRWSFELTCLTLAALLLTPIPAYGEPLTKIRIAEYGEYLLYAPLYVAEAEGHFRQRGLDVEIIPAGGDEKVFAALLSDDAQFGIGDPTFTAISAQRGKKGVVLGGLIHGVPAWGVTFDKSVPEITNPEQLNGLEIATYPAPSTSYTLQKQMFLTANLEPRIVELAFGTLIPAMRAGKIKIALENEPYVSMAELAGAKRLYAIDTSGKDFAFTGITSLPEYAAAHPDTTQAVLCALSAAAQIVVTDQPRTVSILAKRFPEIPVEAIRAALRSTVEAKFIRRNLAISAEGWRRAVEMRRKTGDLKANPEYSNFVRAFPDCGN